MRTSAVLTVSILLLLTLSTGLWADSGVLAYVEGSVTLERSGGVQQDAAIGDTLRTGDTIYTASGGFAEIKLDSGSSVSISEGSVFNIGEVVDSQSKSRKRGFFRVLLGSVAFKFRSLTTEPQIGNPLAVCSVRGTEFSVYTAADGSLMTVVTDGLVEVSTGAQSTLLGADQGVEVISGVGLGETFEVKKGHLRYEDFAHEALVRIDENPSGSLTGIADQMEVLIAEGELFLAGWNTNHEEYNRLKNIVGDIRREKGDEEGDAAYKNQLLPVVNRGLELNTTYRYYLLSALSIRRHILTGYYIRLRSRYLNDTENPEWKEFKLAYTQVLNLYEENLIPLLEDEDL